MRILHPDEHRAYGETLLALAAPHDYVLSTLIPVSSSFEQLKERIAMIKQFKPVTHRVLVFALPVLAAGLALITFTAAANKKPAPTTTAEKKSPANDEDKPARKIDALQIQFSNETLYVEELEKQIDDLRKGLKLYEAGDGTYAKALEPETVRRIEQDRIRVEQEYVQFGTLYKTLKIKTRSELREMLPTANRDDALDRLLEKLAQTEQQLVVMEKDYTDDHPEVVRQVALIKQINNQIEQRMNGILEGLKALVDARKAILDQLSAQLAEAKKIDADNMEKFRPYFRAKRDLETHQKFRDALYMRLLEAKAERAIGR
jgi:uncharacterized protein involved in exopolysaccharide biosynthesis